MDQEKTVSQSAENGGASVAEIRVRGACIAIPAIAIIAIAIWLTPDKRGFGTHKQLSLPSCSFLARTGWPCPTCGLTTSTSAMAKGRVIDAFYYHPFGIILFAILIAASIVGLAELTLARPVLEKLRLRIWHLVAVVGLLMICWGLKAWIGAACGQFPLR